MPDREEALVKIHIDLGDNPDSGGEAMWAAPLGNDLYELRNSPFYAYTLNFLDIVRAVPKHPDQKPSIESVEQRSGHRTIWVTFAPHLGEAEAAQLAEELNEWRGFFEGGGAGYYTVDVEPDGDYDRVLQRIASWLATGAVIRYRTGPLESDVWEA